MGREEEKNLCLINRLLMVLENISEYNRKTSRLLRIEEKKNKEEKPLWHPACIISTLLLLAPQHPLSPSPPLASLHLTLTLG